MARVLFLVTLLLYLSITLWTARTWPLTGDQPHYLVLIESIVYDGDLDLTNNYIGTNWTPHGSEAPDGQLLSSHMIGLPLLLALPYHIGGRLGATLAVAVLAALAATNVFLLAAEVTRDRLLGVIAWGVAALAPPQSVYSFMIYPEIPGALIVVWSTRQVLKQHIPIWRWFLLGSALAFLPWLVVRFAPLTVLLAGYGLFGLIRDNSPPRKERLAAAIVLVVPLVASAASYFVYLWVQYGSFSPMVMYTRVGQQIFRSDPLFQPGSVLGWLFDQRNGLLSYSPLYMLAIPGMALLVRRHRRDGLFIASLVLVHVVLSIGLAPFAVQWSPPARYLAVISPLMGIGVAVALRRMRQPLQWVLCTLLIVVSLANAATTIAEPDLVYANGHQRSWLLERYSRWLSFDVTQLVPLFKTEVRHFHSEMEAAQGETRTLLREESRAGLWLEGETYGPVIAGDYHFAPYMPVNHDAALLDPAEPVAIIQVWGHSPDGTEDRFLAERRVLAGEYATEDEAIRPGMDLRVPSDRVLRFRVLSTGAASLTLHYVQLIPKPDWGSSWGVAWIWFGFTLVFGIAVYSTASNAEPAPAKEHPAPSASYAIIMALLKMGLITAYVQFYPVHNVYEAEALYQLAGRVQADPTASGGAAIVATENDDPGALVYGPYAAYEPGSYLATYRLRVAGDAQPGHVVTLRVWNVDTQTVVAQVVLDASAFRSDGYCTFHLPFKLARDSILEFPVFHEAGAELWVDLVEVRSL